MSCNCSTSDCGCESVAIPSGQDGDNGWSPQFAVVTDDQRRVLQVSGWTGGTGTEPASGLYVGATGMVSDIADAINIRGASGADGATGQDAYTTLGASFTQPAVGDQVAVTVANSDWMAQGGVYYIPAAGWYECFSIGSPTSIVLTNLYDNPPNASAGATVNSGSALVAGGLMGADGGGGTDGDNAWTTLASGATMPAVSGTVVFSTSTDVNFVPIGAPIWVQGAGTLFVTSTGVNSVTAQNNGTNGNASPGSAISGGALLGIGGYPGSNGSNGTNGVDGVDGTDGADGATWYESISVDPNTLSYSPTPVDNSLVLQANGTTITIWQYDTGSGVWNTVATFTGGTGTTSYLFRAENTVDQPLPTTGTGESYVSFDDDANAPNFDPSNSWIDHIYTFPSNQTGVSFRLMNFTVSRSVGTVTRTWTVTVHTSNGSDPLGSFTLAFSSSGTLTLTQAVYETAAANFSAGDTVWVSINCSAASTDQFQVDSGATFMIA